MKRPALQLQADSSAATEIEADVGAARDPCREASALLERAEIDDSRSTIEPRAATSAGGGRQLDAPGDEASLRRSGRHRRIIASDHRRAPARTEPAQLE